MGRVWVRDLLFYLAYPSSYFGSLLSSITKMYLCILEKHRAVGRKLLSVLGHQTKARLD